MAVSGPGKGDKRRVSGVRSSELDSGPKSAALDRTLAAGTHGAGAEGSLDQTLAPDVALDETLAPALDGDGSLDETLAPDLALDETLAPESGAPTPERANRSGDAPDVRTRPLSRGGRRALSRGDELGRYVVLAMLGAGGMGEVYTAYDPELDRKVALKVIRERGGSHMETAARARLLAEAQALARLSHPNVVTIYDVGTVDDDDVYIAMEFIEGKTFGAWLREGQGREWHEIVETLLEAGRGLAAAHRAGLVHRDFKPDNVLIGDDGRVRVIDFGVALQDEEGAAARVIADVKRRELGPTNTDGLVGTPAYMAPEQFEAHEVGPAADQFAFGVTLYEALAGRLPFAGDTLLTLAESVCSGEVREFERDSPVPRWLQEVVLRALATEPAQRHPSMEDLLDELEPEVASSRWRLVVAGIAIVFLVIGAAALFVGRNDTVCRGFDTQLEGIWGTERKAQIESALGKDVFARIAPVIDGYGLGWVKSKQAACRATHETGEQSEVILGRRMACLDTRLRELDAVLALLAAGVENPEESAATLPSLGRCDNLAALERKAPPPANADPALVRRIEDELTKARALNTAGLFAKAAEIQKQAEESARKIGWEGALSEALVIRGMVEANLGDPRKARETMFEAVRAGAAAEDAEAEAEAWIQLVSTESGGMNEPTEALRWAEHAEIALSRAGGEQSLMGRLAMARSTAYRLLRDEDRALAELEKARALFEHSLGADNFRVARVRGAIGSALRKLGRLEEAEVELRASLARMQELFGADSPSLLGAMNNLALVLRDRDKYDEAKRLLEQSLVIRERTLGPEHPGNATALINLALLEQRAGNFEAVDELWERSHAIRIKALGEDHSKVTWSLYWKALYLYNLGKDREALELVDRVLLRYRAHSSADSYEIASALGSQCELHRRLGQLDKAAALCAEARAMFSRLEPDPATSIDTDIHIAELAIDRQDDEGAATALAGLDAELRKITSETRLAAAHVELVRARLALRRGDAETLRRSAAAARAGFVERGAGYGYYVTLVDALLAER